MREQNGFKHDLNGKGRPQILLIGNGLERACGGEDWMSLLMNRDVCCVDSSIVDAIKDLPFPLKYELMATGVNPPANFTKEDITSGDKRLATMMQRIREMPIDIHGRYALFKKLSELKIDHIFTTNYSYCPEKAFLPNKNFTNGTPLSDYRFNFNPEISEKTGKPKREHGYRIHTGYALKTGDREVGIWHIHGESSAPSGVVLGHDKYGRLLSRIVNTCCGIDYDNKIKEKTSYSFTSWPELFLFGDIYVLGFGFYDCEFDLWWLLKRKQREIYGSGRVYYYQHDPISDSNRHQLLLKSHGVELITNEFSDGKRDSFIGFYNSAFENIITRIESDEH